MSILSLPLLTTKLSVVGKIMCFSSLTEVSTRPVALLIWKKVLKCLEFGLQGGVNLAVTQFTHVSRHFRAWNRKQKKSLGKTVLKIWSQKFTKITCFVPIIRQRLQLLLCLLVFFVVFLHFLLKVVLWTHQLYFFWQIWDHIFKTIFP